MTQPQVNPPGRPEPVTPRWLKISIPIFIALVLVVIAMHLAGVDFGGHLQHMR